MRPSEKIRVGISTCLLGQNVRYNGGHKKDNYVTSVLSQFFEWYSLCPEIEVGMGVPREAVRLVGDVSSPSMVGSNSETDWTTRMEAYASDQAKALEKAGLSGYILKSRSPSCGMERVKVYSDKNIPTSKGVGLFAKKLLQRIPLLPVEEDGRLKDPRLRENFIVRVFCYYRWEDFRRSRFSLKSFSGFHARHKFLVMAHSEKHLRLMGRMVADAKGRKPSQVLDEYQQLFFEALSRKSSARKHTNVMQHIAGFFKESLDPASRSELEIAIEDYRLGLIPLIVPITLLRHHVLTTNQAYLKDQIYLNPHPKEMMILNHV